MKTYSLKPSEVTRNWYVIDASQATLGRVASLSAVLLLGKDKPQFSHHIDCGDYVIIINAENLKVTGDKKDKKIYYHHSNYPGGLKEIKLSQQLEKNPTIIIEKAIRGMLPVNKLRPLRLKRLKIYAGSEHNHTAQNPKTLVMEDYK